MCKLMPDMLIAAPYKKKLSVPKLAEFTGQQNTLPPFFFSTCVFFYRGHLHNAAPKVSETPA